MQGLRLPLTYKGRLLNHGFQPDFICFGKLVVEIKAVAALTDEYRSQMLNYLNATGYALGLLINFGQHPNLVWERQANTRSRVIRPAF